MNAVFKVPAGAAALGFVIVGFAWWISPEFVATRLGMELLSGAGLSTQIADLAAFFLTLGGTILIGLFSANRIWFYPAIMLLGFAIAGRLVAWVFHGAALSIDMIAAEAVVITILLLSVRTLAKRTA
jgi:uncharacterized membrane protein